MGDAKPKPERAGNNTVLSGPGDVDPGSQEEPREKSEVLKELIHQPCPVIPKWPPKVPLESENAQFFHVSHSKHNIEIMTSLFICKRVSCLLKSIKFGCTLA